jgi:hypothetical protein
MSIGKKKGMIIERKGGRKEGGKERLQERRTIGRKEGRTIGRKEGL